MLLFILTKESLREIWISIGMSRQTIGTPGYIGCPCLLVEHTLASVINQQGACDVNAKYSETDRGQAQQRC